MSVMDTLFSIFKNAHPDAADEDIRSHIESMKASPEQMSGALAPFTPPTDGQFTPDAIAPDITSSAPDMSMKFQTANSTPSNFDTGISDNTVTQNGSAASVTSAPDQVPAAPPPPKPDMQPVTPMPTSDDVDNSDEAAAAASVAKPTADKSGEDPLKAALAPTPKSEAQSELDKKNATTKKVGAISGLVGGIGDAIGNAAIPFGGKGSSGTQERINENTNAQVDKNKALFDEKQKKDPNSEISKHYQKVLGLMLGEHAKTMDVTKMSADQIASTLPTVEKYMQKELGLQQIKSNKDLQMQMHESDHQDKLEKETREWVNNLSKARNGEVGVQNAKVDAARHLLQLYKQSEETGKPISNSQYGELAMGTAALIAGGANNVSDHTKQMIMQDTAKGDLNKLLTYAGADPSILGGSTDAVLQNLKDTIIRQGSEAEHQRNKFLEDQKATAPSGYHGPLRDTLLNHEYGNSIKDLLPKPKTANPAVPVVSDQQTYDRLPSGASYQDANGKTYRKK